MRWVGWLEFAIGALAVLGPAGATTARAQDTSVAPRTTRYTDAASWSDARGGHAVLVWRAGALVHEHYANGWSADRAHLLASGTKSFAGVLAIVAARDGLLTLDEPVAATITEWRDDPRRRRITIRQLLSLTSGIPGGTLGRPPTYADALRVAPTADPGTRFQYGPAPFQVFGEVMRRKLVARAGHGAKPESPLDYLKRRVLDPIGLDIARWNHGRDGNAQWPSGAWLTAREWGQFGILLANRGTWDGHRMLDERLLQELWTPSTVNPAYGMSFWLAPGARVPGAPSAADGGRSGNSSAPPGIVFAAGALGQRLYVVPDSALVILRFGNTPGDQWDDRAFLSRIFPER